MIDGYYLGCPIWGLKDWVGNLYTKKARSQDYLPQYARVFNAVEGNTTFYGLPTAESVMRWRDATPLHFRFSFKFPRTITHELALESAEFETAEFLERMEPLGERLGPFMIQMPPSFGPDRIEVLDYFLRSLPADFHYAVELRHRDFYKYKDTSQRVNDLLGLRGAERIMMDTRPMRRGDPSDPDVQRALHKKPDLPVEAVALGPHPILRFVCHPNDEVNVPWMEKWHPILVRWLKQGRRPYVFVHCPNDFHSPRFACQMHGLLNSSMPLGTLPAWPGADEEDHEEMQLRLF